MKLIVVQLIATVGLLSLFTPLRRPIFGGLDKTAAFVVRIGEQVSRVEKVQYEGAKGVVRGQGERQIFKDICHTQFVTGSFLRDGH